MDGAISFYRRTGTRGPEPKALPAALDHSLWLPRGSSLKPDELPVLPWAIWAGFHHARIFRSRDYGILLLLHDREVVHRAIQFPAHFRFPFMGPTDLQIGDVWTAPAWRGQGLATWSLIRLLHLHPNRTYWYLTDSANESSCALAARCDFRQVGQGHRTRPLGARPLGRYVLDRPAER